MLAVIIAFIAFTTLLFMCRPETVSLSVSSHIYFIVSAFSAFSFLAIGSFVWLYARDRRIAFLLFGFCLCMMVAFCLENQPSHDTFLTGLSISSSIGAVLFLSDLLTLFPTMRDWTASFNNKDAADVVECPRLMRLYIWSSSVIGCVIIVIYIYFTAVINVYPAMLGTIIACFIGIELLSVIFRIISFLARYASSRERQQVSLFAWGIVITAAPFLFLTLLPQFFGLAVVDARISLSTACFFPFALGYSILRYQILVFDTYVRRVVSFFAGVAFVIALVYAIMILGNSVLYVHLFGHKAPWRSAHPGYFALVIAIAALSAPLAWWLAHLMTERLFFREILHYRRSLDEPSIVTDEVMSVSDAASLITSTAIHTFDTPYVCVFALDEGRGQFTLAPALADLPGDMARMELLTSLRRLISPLPGRSEHVAEAAFDVRLPLFRRLAESRRPLLLSEALRAEGDKPVGLQRYLKVDSSLDDEDWMLTPLRAQGKVIGLLVLGERGIQQAYAGPEMEAAHLLQSRFSPVLEAARLYERANQHATLLNRLYRVSTMPHYAFHTAEDAADIYACVAAASTAASAEVWFYDETQHELRRVAQSGNGPHLSDGEYLKSEHRNDWLPSFFRGGGVTTTSYAEDNARSPDTLSLPPCLQHNPSERAFAWLPLQKDTRRLGVLVIIYEGYHRFAREEKRILEMFANQCVATLENVRMTSDLRLANERLTELDRLKDEFMTTASHELRTPLTAVAGYVELLDQYHMQLSPGMRADFIEKARRSCDELTLLVGNIMDASRVSVEIEKIALLSLPLRATVEHIFEILEPTFSREQRSVKLDIATDILILADDFRLRQVLLNLLSNALKYSAAGSPLEIWSQVQGQMVCVSVRDYGAGIPVQDQAMIFERFVRLERDINSPVRGAGLGLYICRQLIEAMGGQIWVESNGQAGEGCTFTFSLGLVARSSDHKPITAQLPA
jgi:signal transduction histidine kinase